MDANDVPDLQELAIGEDPNDPAADHPLCCAADEGPIYGGARMAHRGPVDDISAAAAVAVALSAIRRRR